MRHLTANRLESTQTPTVLGGDGQANDGSRTSPEDAAETLRTQKTQIFEAARQEGFSTGLRDAEAEVKRQVEKIAGRLREEHVSALKRLQDERERLAGMAAALQKSVADHADDAETLAVEVAFAAVARLLGEKSADRSLMVVLCQRIVHDYGHPPATLRISEPDMALLESIEFGIPVEIDRRLAPGQCVIDTARGQFESGLDVRLEALRRALLATVAEHRGKP